MSIAHGRMIVSDFVPGVIEVGAPIVASQQDWAAAVALRDATRQAILERSPSPTLESTWSLWALSPINGRRPAPAAAHGGRFMINRRAQALHRLRRVRSRIFFAVPLPSLLRGCLSSHFDNVSAGGNSWAALVCC
ncbi:hypothetical protein [Variovorax soli]|uniref:Uncharacterized protein n=1 Tax=Variovorax soli TaxID=376815 RepID=A0ABU1NMV7_9BURK|nr:hypothetical protein [Variovorax soli]MDR6539736.1 hypothetical protein [Variovorax soli]